MTFDPVRTMRDRLQAIRLYVHDCIETGHDRTMLGNLYSARDEIDAILSAAQPTSAAGCSTDPKWAAALARDAALEEAAQLAETVMVCRTKVNRDGAIVEQCRTPTAKEIATAIRALKHKPEER